MWELVERLGFDEHKKILKSMYRNTTANYHWNEVVIDKVRSEIGLTVNTGMYTFTTIIHDSYGRINRVNKENWGGNKNRGRYIAHITVC